MKRLLIPALTFLLCGMLIGCGEETREGLVVQTIKHMESAAENVGTITTKVNEATEDAKKGKPFKLDEAAKAADKLKETGQKIVEIKQRIDLVRSSITDEEKKTYAENQKRDLNKAFQTLVKRKDDLRVALAAAETIDKLKVDELRKKIADAESPFEAQAR